MHKTTLAALCAAVAIAAPLSAQQHAAHAEHDDRHTMAAPIVSALSGDIEQVEEKMLALAEAIPEDRWSWRPGDGVRSIGEVFMHVAADNYFMPVLAGTPAPAETGVTREYQTAAAYERRAMNKAETIAAMRASFAHLRGVLGAVDHEDLMADLDFFGNQMSGTQVWVLTATHLHEHLGQVIAYARSNGVVPPWSRGN
jgi:uncharacterized damage-inducible protein DinB